jgi:GTP-binding protein EngB required for normal cell division
MRYDRERMQTLLDELNNNRETIILLIGQTGSGKTTWINSLANYVRFDSFIEALQHSPTSIVVDANEGANQAYSSTRLPITYTFNDGQNVLRVIDTPGFGDTDGAERDKSNLINILDHIAHYQQLNAIVFCIDAREKRLNEAFIRMIGDLFKFISKDAVDNIIYCMTNASQFDEKDALPAMACIKELAKRSDYRDIIKIQYSNVCCVDNAAFDYWKRKW